MVCVGQPGRLAGVEGAGGGQGLQGVQGRLDPDRGLGAADAELEQLGRPLDVGQPTRAELEVQLRVGPGRDRSDSTRAFMRRTSATVAGSSGSV